MRRSGRRTTSAILAAAVALALFSAACGDDDDGAAASDETGVGVADGSDSVAPSSGGALSGTSPGSDESVTPSEVDLSDVTLRFGDQVHMTETLLEASGQLDGVPYEVEWAQFPAGIPIVEAINAGEIDLGTLGDTPPIFGQSGGTDLKYVATRRATDPKAWDVAILVPEGSDIASVEDLQGQKVSYRQGSNAHRLLLAALQDAGMSWDDIEPVPLEPADGLAAFQGGDIDAWATWEPFVALGESQGGTVIQSGTGLVPGYWYEVARADALEDPALEAAIGDFLVRYQAAYDWAAKQANRPEWDELYAEVTDLPVEISKIVHDRYVAEVVPVDDTALTGQQEGADILYDAGLIPEAIEVGDAFDDRYTDLLSR